MSEPTPHDPPNSPPPDPAETWAPGEFYDSRTIRHHPRRDRSLDRNYMPPTCFPEPDPPSDPPPTSDSP